MTRFKFDQILLANVVPVTQLGKTLKKELIRYTASFVAFVVFLKILLNITLGTNLACIEDIFGAFLLIIGCWICKFYMFCTFCLLCIHLSFMALVSLALGLQTGTNIFSEESILESCVLLISLVFYIYGFQLAFQGYKEFKATNRIINWIAAKEALIAKNKKKRERREKKKASGVRKGTRRRSIKNLINEDLSNLSQGGGVAAGRERAGTRRRSVKNLINSDLSKFQIEDSKEPPIQETRRRSIKNLINADSEEQEKIDEAIRTRGQTRRRSTKNLINIATDESFGEIFSIYGGETNADGSDEDSNDSDSEDMGTEHEGGKGLSKSLLDPRAFNSGRKRRSGFLSGQAVASFVAENERKSFSGFYD